VKNWKKILVLSLLVVALVSVRFFENIFYDPLQDFFESDYLNNKLPAYNQTKLLLHLFFRYLLNAIISIGIIWFAFRNKAYVRFSLVLYSIAFVALLIAFVLLSQNANSDSYINLFYARRFIIQPLFVLLLVPAFYYQEKM